MDTTTGNIRAVGLTSGRQGRTILPELLSQIPVTEDIATHPADGACDMRRCPAAILERDAELILPLRRNGRA